MLPIIRNQFTNKLHSFNQILFRETTSTITCRPRISPLALGSISSRTVSSESSAYDGDGKTTISVINANESPLNLVNTYSAAGFRLHNNLFISGSILLFPTNVFSWNVKRGIDITPESLLIFDLIVPKTKIVIIGYGQYGEEYDPSIAVKLKKKGISCELLATPNAVTTYNYLVHDSVLVAGAFIPVKDDIGMMQRDAEAISQYNYMHGDRGYFIRQGRSEKDNDFAPKEFMDKYLNKDTGKKSFDES